MTFTAFVSNIAFSASSEDLGHAFEKFGQLVSARVIFGRFRGAVVSRGIGFVEFQTKQSLDAAIAGASSVVIKGRTVRVVEARPPVKRIRDTAYMGTVPEGTTEAEILAHFASFNATNCKIVRHNTQEARGFAFIQFASEEDKDRAVKTTPRFTFKGSDCILRHSRRQFNQPPRPGFRRRYRRAVQ